MVQGCTRERGAGGLHGDSGLPCCERGGLSPHSITSDLITGCMGCMGGRSHAAAGLSAFAPFCLAAFRMTLFVHDGNTLTLFCFLDLSG